MALFFMSLARTEDANIKEFLHLRNPSANETVQLDLLVNDAKIELDSDEGTRNEFKNKTLNFDEIITVGKNFSEVKQNVANFLTTEDLIAYLKKHQIKSQNILLKASRGIALEKALDFIQ